MFDKRHFNYNCVYTAKKDNHTGTYTFVASSDDVIDERVKRLFYEEFNEYPTEIQRVSMTRID